MVQLYGRDLISEAKLKIKDKSRVGFISSTEKKKKNTSKNPSVQMLERILDLLAIRIEYLNEVFRERVEICTGQC